MTFTPGDRAFRPYDIVIVGTGPAGSAFARSVRRAAPYLRLLAIEETPHPRDKVCGGALTYRALPLVRTLFPEVGSLPTTGFTREYRLCFPNGRSVARGDGEFAVVCRRVFDEALWNAARSDGVETLEDARVTGLLRSAGRVTGVCVERRSARWNVQCRMVVGADGSTSVVRRCTGSGPSRSRGAAVRQFVRDVDPAARALVFLVDPGCHGYLCDLPLRVGGGAVGQRRVLLPYRARRGPSRAVCVDAATCGCQTILDWRDRGHAAGGLSSEPGPNAPGPTCARPAGHRPRVRARRRRGRIGASRYRRGDLVCLALGEDRRRARGGVARRGNVGTGIRTAGCPIRPGRRSYGVAVVRVPSPGRVAPRGQGLVYAPAAMVVE